MGKYNEVLKGLLFAFEPRFEFSLSQVPGFIPAVCWSVFLFVCLTWSSYIPSTPQLPEARVELMGSTRNKPFLNHLLLLCYQASLGVGNQS